MRGTWRTLWCTCNNRRLHWTQVRAARTKRGRPRRSSSHQPPRRADAAAGHAAELQQALKMAETRIQALVSGDRAESSGTTSPEDSAEALSTQLAHKAHEAYQAREEVLRLRARVSELELEVADLAGARESAAAAASSAREGAKIEIAASAARAADDFAAKSASLRRELDTERSVLQAAVREAQATANKARLDAAAEIAEERRRLLRLRQVILII